METRVLRTFLTIVEERGFTRAAERLSLAQSAVSAQMKGLEAEVGVALFRREGRGFALTAAGGALVARAEEILRMDREARDAVRKVAQGVLGELRLGFMGTADGPFIPSLLQAYRSDYPSVRVSLTEMNPVEAWAALEAGRLDGAFTRPSSEPHEAFDSLWVYDDALAAALPDGHPLALGRAVRPKALATEPRVAFRREGAPAMYDQASRLVGAEPALHAPTMLSVLTLVASGLGVAVVPACLRFLAVDGVEFRPLSAGDARLPLNFVSRRLGTPPTVSAFRDRLIGSLDMIRTKMVLAS